MKRYARQIGLTRGYSAHSMRATFITTALATPRLYDCRGYDPEKSASFVANY